MSVGMWHVLIWLPLSVHPTRKPPAYSLVWWIIYRSQSSARKSNSALEWSRQPITSREAIKVHYINTESFLGKIKRGKFYFLRKAISMAVLITSATPGGMGQFYLSLGNGWFCDAGLGITQIFREVLNKKRR